MSVSVSVSVSARERTCHEICTSRFTKCCTCHEICTSRFTKCCACHEICASRVAECCACQPRNLHIEGHRVLCLPRNLPRTHISKSHDSLRLSRNLSSLTITAMSKVLHLPRKLHFEGKQLRSLSPVTKSRPWSTSLAPATKSDPHVRKCARHHNESAVARSTRRGHPDAACAVEVHMDDVKRHECSVNSSESAAHARAEQRSKHTCFSPTVRTPEKC